MSLGHFTFLSNVIERYYFLYIVDSQSEEDGRSTGANEETEGCCERWTSECFFKRVSDKLTLTLKFAL